MRKLAVAVVITITGTFGVVGPSAGARTATPAVVTLGGTARCLEHGVQVSGSFEFPSGFAVRADLGVSQIGTVAFPWPATTDVSVWTRTSQYGRSAGVTHDAKVVDTTDPTTWTSRNYDTTSTVPSGDTWYHAWYSVQGVDHGLATGGYAEGAFHCGQAGDTARLDLTFDSWATESGTGS